MKSAFSLLSMLVFLTGHMALGDLILITPRTPTSSVYGNIFNRRQDCAAACTANDGSAVCQAADEVCCQLASGTSPYTCPSDYPYCCPSDAATGTLLCGSDSSCGGQLVNGPTPTKKNSGSTLFAGNELYMAVFAAAVPAIVAANL
jgi:hypothetical protein